MRAPTLPFAAGWRWTRDAFRLWRRAPALTAYVSFGYLLLLLLLSAVPLFGQFLAAVAMPILQMGVLAGMRAAERGLRPGPEVLFEGFKGPWQALAAVGALNFIANLLLLLVLSLTMGEMALFRPMVMQPQALDGAMAMGTAFDPMPILIFLLLSLPITAAYWFAPPLIAWHHVPWPKALFFSFYACLRNWAPLLAWTIAMALILTAAGVVVALLASLVHPMLFTVALFLLPLVFVPVLFAGYYRQVDELFLP